MNKFLIFLGGVCVGALGATLYYKKVVNDITNKYTEETEEMQQRIERVNEICNDVEDYKKLTNKYTEEHTEEIEDVREKEYEPPFIVYDSEFNGTYDFKPYQGYLEHAFTYHIDGIVADRETGDIIDDYEQFIGDTLERFDENESVSYIYVCNHKCRTIFKVHRSLLTYAEANDRYDELGYDEFDDHSDEDKDIDEIIKGDE